MAVIRCVLLPNKMKRLSEDFSSALKNAAWCATSSEDGTAATRLGRRSGRITERRLEVEIENQSSESFLFDNDWFKHGSWVDGAVDCLPPGTTTTLKLCNSDFTSGVSGLFWYVNEARFDVYLSLVFSHPLASEAAFDAFLGAPPAELHSEWCQAPPVSSESNRHGCQWRVLERGPVLRLKVTLPESLPRAASGLPMPEAEQRVLVVRGEAQAQAQQGREESEVTAPSFMDVTRPRDFIDGVGSGLTAASVGFAAGSAALVAAPAVGLSEGGVPGFVLGLAQGGAAALGLAACGTAACAAQVARGMLNTPEALMQQDGTRWDSTRGKWVDDFVNLREEEADKAPEDCESEEDSPLFGSAYKKEVADSSYYDIIGVKPGSLPA
ncbi:gacC, partial [Symbiodinium necroappetens]